MALPAIKPVLKRVDLAPISAARAAENSECVSRSNLTIGKGLKIFFGLDDPQYRVVVGSFKKVDDANALAAKVNAEDPAIKASVFGKAPCNDYYAVTVGGGAFLPIEQAKKLQSKALDIDGVPGAYLSPER
jgi:hypothetical protein